MKPGTDNDTLNKDMVTMRNLFHTEPHHFSRPSRFSRLAGASLAVATLIATTAPALAQSTRNRSIINGSFEDPAVAGAGVFRPEDAVPGWETSASDNIIELWRSTNPPHSRAISWSSSMPSRWRRCLNLSAWFPAMS